MAISQWRHFAVALRSSMCTHVDHLYMTDLCLSTCFDEFTDLQQKLNESLRYHSSIEAKENTCVNNGWWRHLVAGGVAGAVSRTSTAPLDRLKCMFMVLDEALSAFWRLYLVCQSLCDPSFVKDLPPSNTYKNQNQSLTSVVRHMLEEGGAKSFWRGNAINIVKVVPEMALKFMIYEQIKCSMKGSRELGIGDRFLAGSIAGAMAQSVIYPLEVLKTKLVIRQTGQYKGVLDCARRLWHKERLSGFYRGFVPNILGIMPYAGIDLAVYETLKRLYVEKQSNEVKPGPLILLICGIISSSCGQLASYPLSLVRTRLQANVDGNSSGCATMSGTFRSILASDGVTGLYRGLLINFMKVAPAVSLSYVVYERARGMLGITMT